jgi:hypothetical protein
MINPNTFRLFISSTFANLKDERDLLAQYVYPQLKRYCQNRRMQFQVIDMRWSVDDRASYSHQTLDICRQEVINCRSQSLEPNFLLLLADSGFGQNMLPPQIAHDEFKKIFAQAFTGDKVNGQTVKVDSDENKVVKHPEPISSIKNRLDLTAPAVAWESNHDSSHNEQYHKNQEQENIGELDENSNQSKNNEEGAPPVSDVVLFLKSVCYKIEPAIKEIEEVHFYLEENESFHIIYKKDNYKNEWVLQPRIFHEGDIFAIRKESIAWLEISQKLIGVIQAKNPQLIKTATAWEVTTAIQTLPAVLHLRKGNKDEFNNHKCDIEKYYTKHMTHDEYYIRKNLPIKNYPYLNLDELDLRTWYRDGLINKIPVFRFKQTTGEDASVKQFMTDYQDCFDNTYINLNKPKSSESELVTIDTWHTEIYKRLKGDIEKSWNIRKLLFDDQQDSDKSKGSGTDQQDSNQSKDIFFDDEVKGLKKRKKFSENILGNRDSGKEYEKILRHEFSFVRSYEIDPLDALVFEIDKSGDELVDLHYRVIQQLSKKHHHNNHYLIERSLSAIACCGHYGIDEEDLIEILSYDEDVMRNVSHDFYQRQEQLPLALWLRIKNHFAKYIVIKQSDSSSIGKLIIEDEFFRQAVIELGSLNFRKANYEVNHSRMITFFEKRFYQDLTFNLPARKAKKTKGSDDRPPQIVYCAIERLPFLYGQLEKYRKLFELLMNEEYLKYFCRFKAETYRNSITACYEELKSFYQYLSKSNLDKEKGMQFLRLLIVMKREAEKERPDKTNVNEDFDELIKLIKLIKSNEELSKPSVIKINEELSNPSVTTSFNKETKTEPQLSQQNNNKDEVDNEQQEDKLKVGTMKELPISSENVRIDADKKWSSDEKKENFSIESTTKSSNDSDIMQNPEKITSNEATATPDKGRVLNNSISNSAENSDHGQQINEKEDGIQKRNSETNSKTNSEPPKGGIEPKIKVLYPVDKLEKTFLAKFTSERELSLDVVLDDQLWLEEIKPDDDRNPKYHVKVTKNVLRLSVSGVKDGNECNVVECAELTFTGSINGEWYILYNKLQPKKKFNAILFENRESSFKFDLVEIILWYRLKTEQNKKQYDEYVMNKL